MAVPLFIIAGQSNAEGETVLSQLPLYIKNTIKNSHLYSKVGGDTSTDDGIWTTLQPCVNTFTEVGFTGFGGIEISMAWRLQNLYGINPYFVKAGYGATTLGFIPGVTNWDPTITGAFSLYRKLIDWYTSKAIRDIGVTFTPFFIWIQGETDAFTGNTALANAYQTNLPALIAKVRTDLSAPTMPFIIFRLRTDMNTGYINQSTVIAAENAVAIAVPNTYIISNDDNPYFLGEHYSTLGYVTQGIQVADLYMQIK